MTVSRHGPLPDIRQWIDSAGTFHIEIEPQRYADADPQHLTRLRAQLVELQQTILDILWKRQPRPGCSACFENLLETVGEETRDIAERDRRRIMIATIAAMRHDIRAIDDWATGDSALGYSGKELYMLPPNYLEGDILEAIAVLSHIVEEVEQKLEQSTSRAT